MAPKPWKSAIFQKFKKISNNENFCKNPWKITTQNPNLIKKRPAPI